MATSTSPLARQPDKLDYASPTQFRFGIHQLPKVEFFTIGANLPGISADVSNVTTPFKDIPMMGDILAYENLLITFIVDEYLENYTSLHNWMTGYGFPKSREQFSTFRDETSNTPATPKAKTSAETIKRATPDKAMYADAFILMLSNKNNPIIEIAFQNVFPISLGALDFTQTATDVEYITTTAEFAYQIYEIKTL